MTTISRDLTPVEVARLAELRVKFSGHPDAEDMIDEEERDMRSTPVPPPCPSWCDYSRGHLYDSANGSPTTRTEVIRFHEQGIGDHAMVAQQESCSVVDGTVTLGTPYDLISADGLELTDVEAERLATCVRQAAALLREVTA